MTQVPAPTVAALRAKLRAALGVRALSETRRRAIWEVFDELTARVDALEGALDASEEGS
jgi:hypothetical protein